MMPYIWPQLQDVAGCPPRPEQIIDGLMRIQDLVHNESGGRRSSPEYKALLESYGIKTIES